MRANRILTAAVCATSLAVLPVTSMATARHDTSTPRRPATKTVRVHMELTGAAPAYGTPACEPGGQCVYPFTTTGTVSGDVTGTYALGGTAAINPSGAFQSTETLVFTAKIAGCGAGTFAVRSAQDTTTTSGSGFALIAHGSGTGDLVGLRGFAEVSYEPPHVVYDGVIRCRR